MLLQVSNIRFEIKIYFQLGMDFIPASFCGLSLSTPPPLPTPTGPFHWIATPPLDEVSWLFPSEEKIKSTITAPPEIAHFPHIPKKVSKDQRYWHSHPTRKLIHWCEVGGGRGGIKWNDTLTISSMYAILSLLIIWIDYKPFPRPSARITRN